MNPEDFGRPSADEEAAKPAPEKKKYFYRTVHGFLMESDSPVRLMVNKESVIDRSEGSQRPDGRTAAEVHRELAAKLKAATKRAKRRERRNKEAAAGGWQ